MAVKRTAALSVAPSQHLPADRLAIHPNDGFDLGLFTKSHDIAWSMGICTKEFIDGDSGSTVAARLELLNECPAETVQMNYRQWEKIGSPEKAICLLDGQRFYVNGLPKAPKKT